MIALYLVFLIWNFIKLGIFILINNIGVVYIRKNVLSIIFLYVNIKINVNCIRLFFFIILIDVFLSISFSVCWGFEN